MIKMNETTTLKFRNLYETLQKLMKTKRRDHCKIPKKICRRAVLLRTDVAPCGVQGEVLSAKHVCTPPPPAPVGRETALAVRHFAFPLQSLPPFLRESAF